jgi:hypothetical protein
MLNRGGGWTSINGESMARRKDRPWEEVIVSDEFPGKDVPDEKACLLSTLAITIAILAAAVTVLIAWTKGDGSPVILVIALWAITPYALLGVIAWKSQERFAAAAVAFAASVLICGSGVYMLYDAFYVHIDALNGLIFLGLPCLQWAANLLTCVVVLTMLLRPGDIVRSSRQQAFPVQPRSGRQVR